MALEELRGFAPYERLNERIDAFPREGDTVTAIFTQVIERLAEEFNQKLVEAVLTLPASARRGLSEQDGIAWDGVGALPTFLDLQRLVHRDPGVTAQTSVTCNCKV